MPDSATHRGCGTYLAYLLHRALDEFPCMPCYRARWPGGLLREGLPSAPPLALGPVSEFEAQRNRRVL